MINIPIVDDRLDIRVAGEWTKRQGYTFNAITDEPYRWPRSLVRPCVLGVQTHSILPTKLVWEHFSEDDDRMRTSKQLCKTDVAANICERRTRAAGRIRSQTVFRLGASIGQSYRMS